MEDDLPQGAENARHFYIEEEEEGAIATEVSAKPETPSTIGQFLKLPQRIIQAPRVLHEPLLDYSQSQILTSEQHIQSMVYIAHKKSIVAQERVERVRQFELTKVQRVVDRALKEAAKNVKAVDKVKRELTLKK